MEFHCNSPSLASFPSTLFLPLVGVDVVFNDDDVVIVVVDVVVFFLSFIIFSTFFFPPAGSATNQISVATQLLNLFCSPLAGFGILEERKSESGFWVVLFFSWVNASPPPASHLLLLKRICLSAGTHMHAPFATILVYTDNLYKVCTQICVAV